MHEERPFYRLNEEFYSGNAPSTYFRDRLTLLALRAAKREALADAAGDGSSGASSESRAMTSPTRICRRATRTPPTPVFVATESQVLFHHTVEALLRMLLAHEGWPECPWLRIAAKKDHGAFRDDVAELAKSSWPEGLTTRVAEVFMGGVLEEPTPAWTEHHDNATRLSRILAARLNDQSTLHNAAKHGLTLVGGTASIHFSTHLDIRIQPN